MRAILLYVAAASGLTLIASAGSTSEIRVLSWNINKGKRLTEISQTLRTLNPDVCLLQEVDTNAKRTGNISVTEELGKDLGYTPLFTPAYRELGQESNGDEAWMGQSTLARLPLKASRKIAFHAQSSFWKPKPWLPNWPMMQRREGGRIAQVTEFNVSGRTLAVYNLHLESRSASARRAQLRETLEDARRYDEHTPVVIAGDLNTHFNKENYVRQLSAEGFRNCFGERQPRTHKFVGTVDWIFVRGPVACSEAKVHREIGASDHFPLTATLSVGETQGAPERSNKAEWQNKEIGKPSR